MGWALSIDRGDITRAALVETTPRATPDLHHAVGQVLRSTSIAECADGFMA